jgi:hypothetical protein
MSIRSLLATALVVLCAGLPAAGAAQDASTTPSPSATTFAIHAYVDGEDDAFAKLQGDPTGSASKRFTYYGALLNLPGASACAVYTVNANGDRFATCDFDAASEDEAQTLWAQWTKNIDAAEPGWKTLSVNNGRHLAQVIVSDPQRIHGIYMYVEKNDAGGYRLTTTFGTMKAIQS